MATYVSHYLSGSTDGAIIPVAATATPGTLIHTASATVDEMDEVYLYASNVTGTDATLTIEWGGVSDPGSHLVHALVIPANSQAEPVATGQRIGNGLIVRAFSGTAGAINISGGVNRRVP